jgi:hypothetical protein
MKREYLNNNHKKDKKEMISVGLLGASAVMVVLMVIEVTGFLTAPIRAEQTLNKAVAQSKPDDEEVKKHLDASKSIADKLKKKNLFAPPPPKKHPVNQVLGILGDEVLINGKWYKAGDNVGDAKIVAIEPTLVRIEWDGNEKTFLPIDTKTSAPSGPRRGGGPDRPQVAKEGGQGQPESVQVQLEVRGGEGMGRFGGGGDMFERMRAMRERFENMSPEERERMRAEMRDRFGGGRGPRGEGGFGGRRGGRGGR